MPTPRGLSQAPTSFFGSWYQGIHRVPLLTWQLQMMLASTVQFSRYGRSRPATPYRRSRSGPSRVRADWRPFPQDPTACSARATPWPTFRPVLRGAALAAPHGRTCRPGQAPGPNNQCSTNERSPRDSRPGNDAGRISPGKARLARQLLLRKEVIQPHLPVRLPCYDFVPIAGPTFDGSLPYGLGHRLRVLPTFVT